MLPTMQMLSSFSQISCLGKGESLGMPFLEHLHDTPLTQATLLLTDGLQVAVNTMRDKDCLTGTMMARNSYCTQPQLQKTNKKWLLTAPRVPRAQRWQYESIFHLICKVNCRPVSHLEKCLWAQTFPQEVSRQGYLVPVPGLTQIWGRGHKEITVYCSSRDNDHMFWNNLCC